MRDQAVSRREREAFLAFNPNLKEYLWAIVEETALTASVVANLSDMKLGRMCDVSVESPAHDRLDQVIAERMDAAVQEVVLDAMIGVARGFGWTPGNRTVPGAGLDGASHDPR